MKNRIKYLGELDLQVEFQIIRRKTVYRTITHPSSFVHKTKGNRSCLNLATNKAENLTCNKKIKVSNISEVSESK